MIPPPITDRDHSRRGDSTRKARAPKGPIREPSGISEGAGRVKWLLVVTLRECASSSYARARATKATGSRWSARSEARTNDLEPGAGWRRISDEDDVDSVVARGHPPRGSHQVPSEVTEGWQARLPRHLFAPRWGAWCDWGHDQTGLNQFADPSLLRVLPLVELAAWSCPSLTPPPPAPGSGSRRRAGRSRRA